MDISREWRPWTADDVSAAAKEGWELTTTRDEANLVLRYLGDQDTALRVRDAVQAAAAAGSDLHVRALLLEGAPAGAQHNLTCTCPCCESSDIRSNDVVSSTQPVLTWQLAPSTNGAALVGDSFGSGSVHYDTTQPVPGEEYFCGNCDSTFTRPFIEGVDAYSDRERIKEWNQLNALAHAPMEPGFKDLSEHVIGVLEGAAALIGKYPVVYAQMDASDRDVLNLAGGIAKAARTAAQLHQVLPVAKADETSPPTMAMR
ncbi:MAG: hypothetical protein ABIW82_17025 [Dokdonella sp.]